MSSLLNAQDNSVITMLTIKCKCGIFIDIRPNDSPSRTCGKCGTRYHTIFKERRNGLVTFITIRKRL